MSLATESREVVQDRADERCPKRPIGTFEPAGTLQSMVAHTRRQLSDRELFDTMELELLTDRRYRMREGAKAAGRPLRISDRLPMPGRRGPATSSSADSAPDPTLAVHRELLSAGAGDAVRSSGVRTGSRLNGSGAQEDRSVGRVGPEPDPRFPFQIAERSARRSRHES